MRDVLEELLEEQEEPREEPALNWDETALPRRRSGPEEERPDTGPASAGPVGGETQAPGEDLREGETRPFHRPELEEKLAREQVWPDGGAADIRQQENSGRYRRAEGGRERGETPSPARNTGRERLYQTLRRQAGALAYGGAPGRSTPIALERPGPAGGSALLDWDRAVERDARRYDGPFPLY